MNRCSRPCPRPGGPLIPENAVYTPRKTRKRFQTGYVEVYAYGQVRVCQAKPSSFGNNLLHHRRRPGGGPIGRHAGRLLMLSLSFLVGGERGAGGIPAGSPRTPILILSLLLLLLASIEFVPSRPLPSITGNSYARPIRSTHAHFHTVFCPSAHSAQPVCGVSNWGEF